jgi:hypothetical protein
VQFQQVYEVALMAAEKGVPAVSLRAMAEAVRGGPPVAGKTQRNGGRYTSRTINGTQYYVLEDGGGAYTTVDQALVTLVPKWRAAGVPPADMYEVLAAVVLPAARPAEVFLYTEGRGDRTLYTVVGGTLTPAVGVVDDAVEDRGLGALLVDTAVQAGKADDLRARLAARAGQPLAELSAKVLLAQLAVAAKDDAGAAEQFTALGERLRKESVQATNERVVGVLLPALADPKFADRVAPFVEKAAENFAAGNNPGRAIDLRMTLADHHLGRKDVAAARAQFKAVEGLNKGDGTATHAKLAAAYLKAGWAADALRELGLQADRASAAGADPAARANRAEPTLGEFPRLVRLLLGMPAAERYEALKAWTLPTAGRKSVRYYVGTTPKHVPPPALAKLPPVPANTVVSTVVLLADAAKEAGKLPELTAEADRVAAEKVDGGDTLRVLVYLSQGRGKDVRPAVTAYADAARTRMADRPAPQPRTRYAGDAPVERYARLHPSEYLFATFCLADPTLTAEGEKLLTPMLSRARNQWEVAAIGRAREAADRLAAGRAGAPDAVTAGAPAGWHSAAARAVWYAQDGYVVAGWNDQPAYLLLDTPLAGTFEFSVDAYQGLYTEGHASYAGVVYEPNRSNVASSVYAVGKHDSVNRSAEGMQTDRFNRLTFQVSPGKVRCLVNGKLFYEDTDPAPTSPWVGLMADAGRRPVFRNPVLSGTPEVPAEVRLSAGNYLEGWVTHVYSGNLPKRLMSREPEPTQYESDSSGRTNRTSEPTPKKEPVYDWRADAGEIKGRRLDRSAGGKPVPSKLAYFRPLRVGETVRYEFLYEPGKTHATRASAGWRSSWSRTGSSSTG